MSNLRDETPYDEGYNADITSKNPYEAETDEWYQWNQGNEDYEFDMGMEEDIEDEEDDWDEWDDEDFDEDDFYDEEDYLDEDWDDEDFDDEDEWEI